jgi:polyisoprenoid-binding protein YceI
MIYRRRGALALCIGLLIASEALATSFDVKASGAKTFYVDGRAGNNQISVFSESTLEDFTSICNHVRGQCKVDAKNIEGFTDHFSFRWSDLDTGIPLRNQQMLSADWMDAQKYPEVAIEIRKVEDVKKTGENLAEMVMVGTCTMHGVTRPVRIPVSLAYLDESPQTKVRVPGDVIRVRGSFEVKLSDYGIIGPQGSNMIGLKVSDVQKVKFSVFGSTSRPPEELKADTRGLTSSQPAGGGGGSATGGVVRPPPPRPKSD